MPNESSIDFIAGWMSGTAAVIACQPVDTVLTRMQAGVHLSPSAVGTAAAPTTIQTKTIFRGLVSSAGMSSLWRGSTAMIGAIPLQNALLMSGYGAGKRWSSAEGTAGDDGNNGGDDNNGGGGVLFGVFIGGCVGGIAQSFLMSPVELIKVKRQVSLSENALGVTQGVARGILTTRNSWRGLNATLLRDGIPHGVWFVSYEYAKDYLEARKAAGVGERRRRRNGGDDDDGFDDVFIPLTSGAFAATVAWGLGYPFDLIKTRIQAGGTKSLLGTARELIRESGGRAIGGLYRGFTLKLLRAVPASAIGFVVYEAVKKQLSS